MSKSLLYFTLAAFIEIAGCFAFWVWSCIWRDLHYRFHCLADAGGTYLAWQLGYPGGGRTVSARRSHYSDRAPGKINPDRPYTNLFPKIS
jgi:hypothetical protein